MIKCIRCNQEISRVEDIGKLVRKRSDFYNIKEFCFCSKCVDSIPGLMDDELEEWYRLINAADDILDFSHTDSAVFKSNMNNTTGLSDIDMEYQEGEAALMELEDGGAFADEGIMPGCHSGWSGLDYELQSISRYFNELEEIGHIIGMLREAFKMTLEELEGRLGIPANVIESIERGNEEGWEKMDDSEVRDLIKRCFHNMLIKEYEKKYPPFI